MCWKSIAFNLAFHGRKLLVFFAYQVTNYFCCVFIPTLFKKAKGILQSLSPSVCPSVCPLCYLLQNHWTKFNQIWCVSYSHEWGLQQQKTFWPRPLGPLGGVKYHLISITKSISKIFIPNFVCVLTNERYKTYQTGFLFCRLGHAPGVELRGPGGAQGVKSFFFQTWLCGISKRRGWWAEQYGSKIFMILGSNWWPWGEVKRSNIIKF